MGSIAVVTSAWGAYGRFLPAWIKSVAAQTRKPDLVTIVDAGLEKDPGLRRLLSAAVENWQVVSVPYRGMGAARNAAVAHSEADWVMHLDADDVLLSHALEDAEKVAKSGADVVAIGMRENGRDITFPRSSRQAVLRGELACFSCALFRRSFWVKRPYITANDWVDSALWLGFAQAGAVFKPTKRAGAVYVKHPDSFSRKLTPQEREAAKAQFLQLRRNPSLRL